MATRIFRHLLVLSLFMGATRLVRADPVTVRVGFFPNVTHAQGIIGYETTREGHGWFEQRLGPGVAIHWYAFNAGPSAMEAIFAGAIDLTYVGPSPALNAYMRSNGDEVRILAGAADGGAALVVAAGGPIHKAADFRGRRIATPQLGNTQDVAARTWLKQQGFRVTLTGGDVTVLPVPNTEQFALFQSGQLDGVWTVEPWVSRLVNGANGRIFLQQDDAVTTVLVSSVKFLREHPSAAVRFRAAHLELTQWILQHPGQAEEIVAKGLGASTGRPTPLSLVAQSWPRLHFTNDVSAAQLGAFVSDAQSVGFLRNAISLDRLFGQAP